MRMGPAKMHGLLPRLDSREFSPELFAAAGVFVIRQAIPQSVVESWKVEWHRFYEGKLDKRAVPAFNPVHVQEGVPSGLVDMPLCPGLLRVVERVFGRDVALFQHRFVIKDKGSRGPVFLHNDFGYHRGWPRKASAFVPLSVVTLQNGGLSFLPGTHHFGYLGDAGEIDIANVDPSWPTFTPNLEPGDFVLMDSSTWHYSAPHTGGPDRILADIIYQPADDPSGVRLLQGEWRTDTLLSDALKPNVFKRSRVTMLREKDRRIEELENSLRSTEHQ